MDSSFLEGFLTYIQQPSNTLFAQLMEHPAAIRVHAHATQWQNTNADLPSFWTAILKKERHKGPGHHQRIQTALEYLTDHRLELDNALTEMQEYLPPTLDLDCYLYLMLGYDIGIVSQGDALLNLGHPLFHQESRELLYFAMHEVHHVGYTHLHPFFTLEELTTLQDLRQAIQYSTHLEGLAVYTPLQRRLTDQVLTHTDYPVLLNAPERDKRVHHYFDIYNNLSKTPDRPLQPSDFEVFDIMSGQQQRLWYITGAHMAQTVDTKLGRDALLHTISAGSANFFKIYEKALTIP
jgi:hypothetical protein